MKMKVLALNKNKLLSIFLILTIIFIAWMIKYNTISLITLDGNFVGYDSFGELDSSADLVIVGVPTQDFLERDHVTTYYPSGDIQDFFTRTEIKVMDVLKNAKKYQVETMPTLDIIEPIGLIQEFDGKKKLVFEGYSELKKDSKYVLFLKENYLGEYSIINNDLGKFNLDDDEDSNLSSKDGIHLGDPDKQQTIKKKEFRQELFKTYPQLKIE